MQESKAPESVEKEEQVAGTGLILCTRYKTGYITKLSFHWFGPPSEVGGCLL